MGDLEVSDSQFTAVNYRVAQDRTNVDYSIIQYLNGYEFNEELLDY